MDKLTLLENIVYDTIKNVINDSSINLSAETPLIGCNGCLDSMGLVEVCVALEDKACELGFQFDWMSETAMSPTRSMFRTVGTLVNNYLEQAGKC